MNTTHKLKIALIQTDLLWEKPKENRSHIEAQINKLSSDIDLIILPEMFTTGFTMNAKKVAEKIDGDTVTWMQKLVQEKDCAITGSIIIKENESFFNRLLFVHPSGKFDFYDKKHTFTLAGEHEVFSSGNNKILIDYKGWKICPLICYDLRFPVWARNTNNYDLLLYVASWPKKRIEAWDTLLKARAIENMSYTIGVNRIGVDANNFEYNGNSVAYDMLGNCLAKNDKSEAVSLIIEIDKNKQDSVRNKFRFLEDRDDFRFQ
ncbi:MAG: amidohydrolase [Tenacibaculum sp.]